MSKFHTLFRVALAASLLAPLHACSDGTGSDETTPVTLLLTDAPGDFKAAVVTISEIYLQGGEGEARVTLMDQPTTVNLLDLANEAVTLVADVPVPAGRYAQLRFVITGGYIEVETADGSAFYASSPDYEALPAGVTAGELQMPSFGSSGLKVNFEGGALDFAGEESILLIDFDVRESFGHEAGSDRWVPPVIRGAEVGTTGTVNVAVTLVDGVTLPEAAPNGLGDFSAVLRDGMGGETTVALEDGDGDGTWTAAFVYLRPGDYGVYLTGPAGVTFTTAPAADAAAPLGVTLGSGGQETVALEISAAS